MPVVSQRGQQMPPSPIRKLVPFAEAAKKKGLRVYHLNIGQPDIVSPQPILDAVRQSDFKILEYSHSAGNESYRRKLTDYYARFNIPVQHDQIIVTTGGSEAIVFALLACLNPGEEVLVPEPFYANYNGFAIQAGVHVRTVTSTIEDGFALPSLAAFEKAITPRTKAIMICNPNNPTGYLYSRQELELLKQLCLQHNLFLLSDEAYREFCYNGTQVSALHLTDMDDKVVLMDTISKRYSACGGRIGALVTRNQEVLDTVMKFAQARLSQPTFAQIAGEAAVDMPMDYFDEIRMEYQHRRDLLVRMLNDIPGVYCPNPEGAFYVMARFPIDDADRFCQWILEEFSYEGQTVMLSSGTGFYATPGLGINQVRMAYVLNQEAITNAMHCLRHALEVYPGSTL